MLEDVEGGGLREGPVSEGQAAQIAEHQVVGLGIGLIWFFGFGPGQSLVGKIFKSQESGIVLAPEKDAPALDFELVDQDGKKTKLKDYYGKTVLINLWASWCVPCREEMPLLEKSYRQHSPDLAVLAVNDGEDLQTIKNFIGEFDLTFPVLQDPKQDVSRLYRIHGLPTTLFVDGQGILRFWHTGILSEEQLKNYLS